MSSTRSLEQQFAIPVDEDQEVLDSLTGDSAPVTLNQLFRQTQPEGMT
jgi:hypothetical protein